MSVSNVFNMIVKFSHITTLLYYLSLYIGYLLTIFGFIDFRWFKFGIRFVQ